MAAVDGGAETVELVRGIDQIRAEFPGLSDGRAALDGAAGTQLPAPVIDAVVAAMRDAMANVHGAFPGSERSTETVHQARRAVADLVGGAADGVVLGPNMTTLTFMLADTLSRSWGPGRRDRRHLAGSRRQHPPLGARRAARRRDRPVGTSSTSTAASCPCPPSMV